MRKSLNRQTVSSPADAYPERIVQFGAGNFLRGFVDWVIQNLNEQTPFASQVVVVKVTPNSTYEELDAQDGLFHVVLRGYQAGELIDEAKLITCVSRTVYPYQDFDAYLNLATQPDIRFIFSNTTEAGITFVESDSATDQPPSSFPAKLTVFLHHRFQHFQGAPDKGCIIIPTELVVQNGDQLREIILHYADLWGLSSEFSAWIKTHNMFCNTLVDRILPGFPAQDAEQIMDRLGFDDRQLVMGEPYHSWIIEAPASLKDEFPVQQTQLNVKIVDDANPFRETKVRILNGAHTSMVPPGILLGLESVRQSIEHETLGQFIKDLVYHEIIPSMNLPEDELRAFADDVFDRFRNPHIHHRLLSIIVNTVPKIKERIVPTIVDYHAKYDALPERVVLAFAAFIRVYKGEWHGQPIPLNDDQTHIDWFAQQWSNTDSVPELVEIILKRDDLWGSDLSTIDGLNALVSDDIRAIENNQLPDLLSRMVK
ncbi:MAG: tagaturonate reductase [Aggregatilineales bacterium]